MTRSVLDMMVDATVAFDADAGSPEIVRQRLVAALAGAQAELVVLRGDPRAYGQGFFDPFAGLIGALDSLTSGKPVI